MTEQQLFSKLEKFTFDGKLIPPYMHNALIGYIVFRKTPGDFLSALLSNNLKLTIQCADDNNIDRLHVYVAFLCTYAPAQCWGSKENFQKWIKS